MITEYNLTISASLMPLFHAMPARSPSYFVKNLLSVFDHPTCVGYGHRKHGFLRFLRGDFFTIIPNGNYAEMADLNRMTSMQL
jgi:hypothetical protein